MALLSYELDIMLYWMEYKPGQHVQRETFKERLYKIQQAFIKHKSSTIGIPLLFGWLNSMNSTKLDKRENGQ